MGSFVTVQLDKFRCCSEQTCSDTCSVCLSATSVLLRSLASTSSLVLVNCIWRSAWRIWRRTMPGFPSKFLTQLCLTVRLWVRSRPWPAWPSPPTNTTGSSWGLHPCPMVWRKPLTRWVGHHAVLAVHCLCWCNTVLKDGAILSWKIAVSILPRSVLLTEKMLWNMSLWLVQQLPQFQKINPVWKEFAARCDYISWVVFWSSMPAFFVCVPQCIGADLFTLMLWHTSCYF